ncbi:hypothetical protein [Bradyrhizobium sp. CCBAU 051011]|nr:hypothetical protein [Bradyrhizobium sp. CCBAU 051011]
MELANVEDPQEVLTEAEIKAIVIDAVTATVTAALAKGKRRKSLTS